MLPAVIHDDLTRLAMRVNEEHWQVQHLAKGMLLAAKAAGEYLLQAKKQCPHGTFKDWIEANCQCSYRTARVYMQVAKTCADKMADPCQFESIDAFLAVYATKRTPQAPGPSTPTFTREDAEYALKIHARAEGGLECERDVAASKLAKVAEGFGMDPETLVSKAHELCPDHDASSQEILRRQAEANEKRIKELDTIIVKTSARLPEVTVQFKDASRDDLLQQIAILLVQLEGA